MARLLGLLKDVIITTGEEDMIQHWMLLMMDTAVVTGENGFGFGFTGSPLTTEARAVAGDP